MDAAHESGTRHTAASPHLDVISAGEVEFAVIEPPGDVNVSARAIFVVGNSVHQRRYEPGHVGAGRVGQVLADHAAGIGEPVREPR